MDNLTPFQQTMLATWQQHTYAEFVLKDADAALATMTENPYVLAVPSGTGGMGRIGVREFYARQFLPHIPPDFDLNSLSQTFGNDRIVAIERSPERIDHTPEQPFSNRHLQHSAGAGHARARFNGGAVVKQHNADDVRIQRVRKAGRAALEMEQFVESRIRQSRDKCDAITKPFNASERLRVRLHNRSGECVALVREPRIVSHVSWAHYRHSATPR